MKPKSLYLPVLVLAFLLASEMPKVNGLNRLLNIIGTEITNFLRQTAEMLDVLLTKPIPDRSTFLDYEKTLTSILLKPSSVEVRETEEVSSKPDSSDESKDKSSSTENNNRESSDSKNSVEKSSSRDTTYEVKEKSSSTENNKSESGDNNNYSTDTTDESKEKSSSTENNKSESGDSKNSRDKNSSTDITDEKKRSGEKCKCKRRNK